MAAFCDRIPNVIALRPEKQMRGIDAGRVVALMKNRQTIRNWTMVNLPRHTMRANGCAVQPEQPIPESMAATRPFPAAVRNLVNIRHEPFSQSLCSTVCSIKIQAGTEQKRRVATTGQNNL